MTAQGHLCNGFLDTWRERGYQQQQPSWDPNQFWPRMCKKICTIIENVQSPIMTEGANSYHHWNQVTQSVFGMASNGYQPRWYHGSNIPNQDHMMCWPHQAESGATTEEISWRLVRVIFSGDGVLRILRSCIRQIMPLHNQQHMLNKGYHRNNSQVTSQHSLSQVTLYHPPMSLPEVVDKYTSQLT